MSASESVDCSSADGASQTCQEQGRFSDELCLHTTPLAATPAGVRREHCLFVSPERLRQERILPGSLVELWTGRSRMEEDSADGDNKSTSGETDYYNCVAVGRVWPRNKLDKYDIQVVHEIYFLIRNILRTQGKEKWTSQHLPGFYLFTQGAQRNPPIAKNVVCHPLDGKCFKIPSKSCTLTRLRNMLDGMLIKDGMVVSTKEHEVFETKLSEPNTAYAIMQWGCTNLDFHHQNSSETTGSLVNDVETGGLSTQKQQLIDVLSCTFNRQNLEQFRMASLVPPQGIILHGSPGTGKTTLARNVAGILHCQIVTLSPSRILECDATTGERLIHEKFSEAFNYSQSLGKNGGEVNVIVLVDEVDALFPKDYSQSIGAKYTRLTNAFKRGMDQLQSSKKKYLRDSIDVPRIAVIATTNHLDSVCAAVRKHGCLPFEIEIPVPTAVSRVKIMQTVLQRQSLPHNVSDGDMAQMMEGAHGFVGADIHSLCRIACDVAIRRCVNKHIEPQRSYIEVEDLNRAICQVQPSAAREIAVTIPNTRWKDIGGQNNVKQTLIEALEWPLRYPALFRQLKVTPPNGVLLFGPPGCSKTMTARALACESGMNFVSVKGPEILGMYVGDSEKAIANVFRKARAAAPCIIFLDEVDSISKARSGGGEGNNVMDRVVTQLLQEMDGIPTDVGQKHQSESSQEENHDSAGMHKLALSEEFRHRVFVVAATNRPDLVDSALLRPGRFDHTVYVGPPDSEARKRIFSDKLQQLRDRGTLNPDVDIDKLVTLSDGCSGAECASVLQEAGLLALNQFVRDSAKDEPSSTPCISQSHLEEACQSITRQITQEMLDFYNSFSRSQSDR